MALYRTQLFGPDELENIKKVQAGYGVQTLSEFLGTAAPAAAPNLALPAWDEKKIRDIGFSEYLDFVLRLWASSSAQASRTMNELPTTGGSIKARCASRHFRALAVVPAESAVAAETFVPA